MRGSLWLDVQSDKDKAVFNFRVGRETVYIPNRHRYPGERVKVEYLIQRGTMVGYGSDPACIEVIVQKIA